MRNHCIIRRYGVEGPVTCASAPNHADLFPINSHAFISFSEVIIIKYMDLVSVSNLRLINGGWKLFHQEVFWYPIF